MKEFNNEYIGRLRILFTDSGMWFLGKDVIKALGLEANGPLGEFLDARISKKNRSFLPFVFLARGNSGEGMNHFGEMVINREGLMEIAETADSERWERLKSWIDLEIRIPEKQPGLVPTNPLGPDQISDLLNLLISSLKRQEKPKHEIDKALKEFCSWFGLSIPEYFADLKNITRNDIDEIMRFAKESPLQSPTFDDFLLSKIYSGWGC